MHIKPVRALAGSLVPHQSTTSERKVGVLILPPSKTKLATRSQNHRQNWNIISLFLSLKNYNISLVFISSEWTQTSMRKFTETSYKKWRFIVFGVIFENSMLWFGSWTLDTLIMCLLLKLYNLPSNNIFH